jgi:hypothetical protein
LDDAAPVAFVCFSRSRFYGFFSRAAGSAIGHDDILGPCFVFALARCRYIKFSGLDILTPIHPSKRFARRVESSRVVSFVFFSTRLATPRRFF